MELVKNMIDIEEWKIHTSFEQTAEVMLDKIKDKKGEEKIKELARLLASYTTTIINNTVFERE